MYICNDCKEIFEEPKTMSAESFYGVSSEFGYSCGTVSMCPHCESTDYDEFNETELNEDEVIY